MHRLLVSIALFGTAVTLAGGTPTTAHNTHSALDERGLPVVAGWTDTGQFDDLTAAGMDNVRFVSGDRWRIRASGDPRAIEQLRYLVEDGKLVVGRIKNPGERYGAVRVEVTAPAIDAATSAGSGNLTVDRISGERARATVAGSGGMDIAQVGVRKVDATIAGSGVLRLAGSSDTANVTIAGSGDFDSDQFTAGSASVTVAGSGDARFRSPGNVRASIMGSGTVTVAGGATCTQTRMGSGRLVCPG